ncbi:MAG: hypothetical protein JXJ04_19605 [Spirochaetales bacterium]|nr:hypothetical protein [Spirochaetales bacterium]
MTIIICDAGPVIHLRETNLLHLLNSLGEIYVPKTVFQEICLNVDIKNEWPEWIKIKELSESEQREATVLTRIADLHRGEAESFILARKMEARMLLTDDTSAMFYAKLINLEVHGSLGIVIWNVGNDYIDKEEGIRAIKTLSGSSLWISEKIVQEAIDAIKSI